jgi:hypothetical protein
MAGSREGSLMQDPNWNGQANSIARVKPNIGKIFSLFDLHEAPSGPSEM